MTNATEQKHPQSLASINDNLPSGNPSGKTVLIVLGAAAFAIFVMVIYMKYF